MTGLNPWQQRHASPHPQVNRVPFANDSSDIYRGRTQSPAIGTLSPDDRVLGSSLLNPMVGRGRLGALAEKVELAITRWARRNSSARSSFLSASAPATNASQTAPSRRRKRRLSVGSFSTVQSERDIVARIKWIKAREEQRHIPRGFTLYVPPPSNSVGRPHEPMMRPVTRTTSLSLILNQLELTLKATPKPRRAQRQNRVSKDPTASHDYYAFVGGKVGDEMRPRIRDRPTAIGPDAHKPKAWFLDVASPTWEDLQAISMSLPSRLHPLTLEDILQRDPREKLELFPKLGYYFISFRAITSQGAKESRDRDSITDVSDDSSQDDGFIGAANVYMVVFNGGVCSFHYTDISEHTDRVINRIVQLEEEPINMSSNWIAHGILDSIVDSFFPLLKDIEEEVIAIDNAVLLDSDLVRPIQFDSQDEVPSSTKLEMGNTSQCLDFHEKTTVQTGPVSPFRPSPRLAPTLFRQFKRTTDNTKECRRTTDKIRITIAALFTGLQPPTTHFTLRRIARTRKLVNMLTRLLLTKSKVIAQIRKRLLTPSQSGLGNGTNKNEDIEVSIYLGDVQDHILTLQHSLAHCEWMLSKSHPAYLSQLQTTAGFVRARTDKAATYLTFVSMAVICVQPLIGVLSLNVTVPQSPTSYHGFGIVVVLCSLILGGYAYVVRWWWIQAERRRSEQSSKQIGLRGPPRQ